MNQRKFGSPRAASVGPWDILVAAAATFGSLLVPARVVGGIDLVPHFSWYDAGLTLLFAADLIVRLRNRTDHPPLRERILLATDLLAALPLQVTGIPAFSLLRLLKLGRVGTLLGHWRHVYLHHWNTLRLVYFFYWLGLCVHWLACGWLDLRGVPPGIDIWTAYVRSLYWCFSTLSTIGYTDNMPVTNGETLYAMVVMIFGVATYGYVVGNAANILANIDPARSGYFNRMEKLSSFMNYRGVPTELQRRVRDYHKYVWEHRLGYDEEEVLSGLPPALMSEVSMYLKRDVIQHVPFFTHLSDQLLMEIARAMHPVVYMTGDTIFQRGEVGDAMYFISRGEVEVLGKEGERIAVLKNGDVFGEMALVLNRKRNATIRALGTCNLYTLDQRAFDEILKRYPEFATHVRRMARQRQGKAR